MVLRLSVRDLVDTEPFVGGSQETWQVSFNILNIVQSWSQWVIDIDDNDLPVGLFFIEQGHDTKNLDLLNLTGGGDKLADLAHIERVVVTLGFGLGVDGVWVLPRLCICQSSFSKEHGGRHT